MKNFTFEIEGATDVESTNNALIKLWSTFIDNGKIGWHYRPFKVKNSISVGAVSIHGFGSYEVEFIRQTRSIVKQVIFKKQNGEHFSKQEIDHFKKIDENRFNLQEKNFTIAIQISIESNSGIKYFYPFEYDEYSVFCIKDKQYVQYDISAYCKNHAIEKSLGISQIIINFLSTQTNSVISLAKTTFLTKKNHLDESVKPISQEDVDWIDEYPINDHHFILPEYSKQFLKKIIYEDDSMLLPIIKASHHFSHGVRLQDSRMQKELIVAQLMSSVEVLTELEDHPTHSCKSCGQPIYSIRKRVLSLIENSLAKHMRKTFDNYYVQRSKYLHSGVLISDRNYSGVCLPKISEKSDSGCEEYSIGEDHNLVEWIGFLIRKKTKETIDSI